MSVPTVGADQRGARMSDSDLSPMVNRRLLPRPGAYNIDPVHTFMTFRAQHLIVGRVNGRFDAVAGTAVIGDDPLDSTLEVNVEAASINTLLPMRDDDLRSERYLDVAHYPRITYRSTGISELPAGVWSIAGDLTLRNITGSVELIARFGGSIADPFGNERLAFHARGAISRKDFGLTTELEKESGGLRIARDVTIDVDAELTRPL